VKPTSADQELATRFAAVLRHIWCSQGSSDLRALEGSGLSVTQAKLLFSLGDTLAEGPRPVSELAEHLGISLASASRAVDGLVRSGFADRVEDEDDRRVRRVSITIEGRKLLDELALARVAGLERFVATLTAAQRRKLDSALDALLERPEISAHEQQLVGAGR
jgi:DNA-binding MarR family transcriptional regulator